MIEGIKSHYPSVVLVLAMFGGSACNNEDRILGRCPKNVSEIVYQMGGSPLDWTGPESNDGVWLFMSKEKQLLKAPTIGRLYTKEGMVGFNPTRNTIVTDKAYYSCPKALEASSSVTPIPVK